MRSERRLQYAVSAALLTVVALSVANKLGLAAPTVVATPGAVSSAVASPVSSPIAGVIEVGMDRQLYLPRRVEAPAGSTIIWVNLEAVPHTVTAPGEFNSGRMDEGGRYTREFEEPGIFWYECLYHNNMTGVVVIT